MDVTLTYTMYLNNDAEQVHHFMAMVFCNGSGILQQYNTPWHSAKDFHEWFEEHEKEIIVQIWLPNFPRPQFKVSVVTVSP